MNTESNLIDFPPDDYRYNKKLFLIKSNKGIIMASLN
jgi:hypothetical protein